MELPASAFEETDYRLVRNTPFPPTSKRKMTESEDRKNLFGQM